MPASAQARVMADGRVDAGPVQLATAPGSAADVAGAVVAGGAGLCGAELSGAEPGAALVGGAVTGTAVPGAAPPDAVAAGAAATGVVGGIGEDAGAVVGDASDDARRVAVAEAAGVRAVLPPCAVHALTARASPRPAPAANFPTKKW